MLKKTRYSRRTVLAGMGAAALATQVRAQSPKTIRIWTFLDPKAGRDPREKVFQKLIESFEAANSGVKIVVEPQNWTQMTDKFFAAHQTKTAPDIMWVIYNRLQAAVQIGALANIDEVLKGKNLWTAADYADIAGPYFEFGSKNGAHYQIVHSRSLVGLLYHSDMLQEAGVDPKSLTTWDDLIAAGKKLTVKDASGNVTRYGFGQVFTTVATQPSVTSSIIMDRNGTMFTKEGKAAWANPAGIEGMTLATDMVRKHGITPPNSISLNGEDQFDVFTSRRLAIMLSNPARIPRLRGIIGKNTVEFLPVPSFTKGKSSPTEAQGWPIGVWSGSPNKETAIAFLAHMSSKAADRMWTMEAGAIPIRKSTVTENAEFFKDPTKDYMRIIAGVMQNSVWFPPLAPVGGWNEELDKAAQAVLGSNMDVKAALERAEKSYNSANGL